jgi:DNA processing protein
MSEAVDEATALFALLRLHAGPRAWQQVAADVAFEGSAVVLLQALDGDALVPSPRTAEAVAAARADLARWRADGLRWATVLDPVFPERLLDVPQCPPFLFHRGDLRPREEAVSVIGSREPSPWGVRFAEQAAELLVAEGLSVASGLAAGIDTAAHRAALRAGGRTVAVLGTGISRTYPSANAALQQQIGEQGLVLSQFLPDAGPTRESFPMRNAVMSGYGLASVVVEAGERSGARIQARVAGEHGRRVILTARVAQDTVWGAALVGAPHVQVVEDLDDLLQAVRFARALPGALRDAIAAAVRAAP